MFSIARQHLGLVLLLGLATFLCGCQSEDDAAPPATQGAAGTNAPATDQDKTGSQLTVTEKQVAHLR